MYSWLRRSFSRSSNGNNKDDTQNLGTPHKKSLLKEEEKEEFYGVTDQLIEFVKSFTLDSFKNCSLPDEQSDGTQTTSGGVRVDLSEWQQQHAIIVLSKVKEDTEIGIVVGCNSFLKELSQLRYTLCPRHLKERQFWRIYFTLVKSYVTEFELRAIQLDKLIRMAIENETRPDTNGVELEMTEAKQASSMAPS